MCVLILLGVIGDEIVFGFVGFFGLLCFVILSIIVGGFLMGRVQTNCSIDEELKREASERGLCFSELLAQAIRMELDPDKEIERLECQKKEYLARLADIDNKIKMVRNRKAEMNYAKEKNNSHWEKAVKTVVEAYHRLGEVPVRSIEYQAKIANCTPKELKEAMFEELSKEISQGKGV